MIISSLDGTPLPHEQQSYYGCSSPTSDLEYFLVDYLPQSLAQKTPFSIASGRGQCKNGRGFKNLCVRTPLTKILDPPLQCSYKKLVKRAGDGLIDVLHCMKCYHAVLDTVGGGGGVKYTDFVMLLDPPPPEKIPVCNPGYYLEHTS